VNEKENILPRRTRRAGRVKKKKQTTESTEKRTSEDKKGFE
jgi:hypothetical protein